MRARKIAWSIVAALVFVPWAIMELLAAGVEQAARAPRWVAEEMAYWLDFLLSVRDLGWKRTLQIQRAHRACPRARSAGRR